MTPAQRAVAKGTKRDITVAKLLAEQLQKTYDPNSRDVNWTELVTILRDLDARRSRREKAARNRARPSAAKKATKRAARR